MSILYKVSYNISVLGGYDVMSVFKVTDHSYVAYLLLILILKNPFNNYLDHFVSCSIDPGPGIRCRRFHHSFQCVYFALLAQISISTELFLDWRYLENKPTGNDVMTGTMSLTHAHTFTWMKTDCLLT